MLSARHVLNRCFPSNYHYSGLVSTTAYLKSHINSFLSNKAPTFQLLVQSHALITTSGNAGNIFLSSKLISFYASFNQTHCSTKIFDLVCDKDAFLWNSIVQSQFSNGNYSEAFELYMQMRLHNTPPTRFTIPMVVSSCAELLWLKEGETVHGLATKSGLFLGNSAVSSSFVYMYAKCGVMDYASRIFENITERDVVSWTALIIGYVHNGESEKGLECLSQMHRNDLDGENINFRTLEGGFQACVNLGALVQGRCLHGFAVKTGLRCWQAIQSSLLLVYCKFGSIEEACHSFSEVDNKDLFSWTSIIGVHVRLGLMNDCMALFWDMLAADNYPDEIVLSCVLLGFGNSSKVDEGKSFHCLIIRRNFSVDQMVADALLSMYCKFGLTGSAEKLFCGLNKRNAESWNSMVCGFAKAGRGDKCIDLFRGMQKLGFKADSNSLVALLTWCSRSRATSSFCRSLHCYIIKNCMEDDISIVNSLIDMYGKDGNLISAGRIFCGRRKDIVTWNTMIAAYSRNKCFTEAISLFDEMMLRNVKPNTATLATVLSACSQVADLDKGEKIHHLIKNNEEIELNVSLSTALVDMFAKCGQLEISREIFNLMEDRDTVSWNVMIAGYAMHGDTESAIEIFKQMEQSNVVPNSLTFLPLLSACAHSGHVDEGKHLFNRMKSYSVMPTLKHYACIVDLLGRSGNLMEAEKLVLSMPVKPDGGVWGALLSACKMHDEMETGIRIAKEAIKADPRNDGYYVVMSGMYSSIGRWKEAEEAREMMKERGIEKRAGWSLV
ncbi:Pentatricopeptide repeat-containing protein At4g39952, mitochondrial [Linum grandiflorum]